jgi:hypothetical protein
MWLAVHDARRAVVGQEFVLFSWRLVLCDAFIMLYILVATLYLVLLGSDLTTDAVISAIMRWRDGRCRPGV